ncbi:aminotransferase class IV [Gramella sp. GC03-9]|uniref:Aminotransferase class IV n=1 Tax=Christiangramia oceanisediminis TaxID=2920386 RepID=A0A9X2KZE7_9FLAO|nr:aminotransferase class IV [Gramella oceanisediminis]MCP9201044.1 aminotransferase class IV [Gramella oceanisediminis]
MLPQIPGKSYPNEVCLNGEWMKPEEAQISVFDRGFMLGDALYEVIPFYDGKVFALEEHLDRLKYSLSQIRFDFEVKKLVPFILQAVERSSYAEEDAAVYLQLSRGTAPRTHFFPQSSEPNFLVYSFPVKLKDFEQRSWRLLLAEDIRWHRCDIKTTSYLANTMLNDESHRLGLDETLLFRDGKITEGSHSTAFFVKDNVIYTHPEGPEILSGITRKIVIDLCRELSLDIREESYRLEDFENLDEVFLTGTTTQVMMITDIFFEGSKIFSRPEAGPVTQKLQKAFKEKTRNCQA